MPESSRSVALSTHVCRSPISKADVLRTLRETAPTCCSASGCDCAERRPLLDAFYAKCKDEPLVVDKWLGVEALSRLGGTVARVKELTRHPALTLKNPNKVYALLGSFGTNQVNFHAADGCGYELMVAQSVKLDAINPQVAARMVRHFERYKRFEPMRSTLMRAALKRIAATPGLFRGDRGSG